jgi:two-component system cell cycle sensor histidine kinase/response regulator CckA
VKPHILIVEDDTIIAAELEDRLQEMGYQVCAKTGTAENAVILAEGLQPDLVLMDIRLKAEMDGVEAAARIRANFDIPVIYLTAYADENTLQRAKVTEPYGYVIKPFEERELHTAVEMGLHKHTLEKQLRESEQWLAATLRSIGDGVVATDEKGRVAFLNRVAERLIGRKQESLTSLNADRVLTLLAGEARLAVASPVDGVLQSGQPLDLADHWLGGREGDQVPIEGSITPIRDHRGRVRGAAVVFRDISARKREEQERERLQARLYQAQKSEALAAMAGSLVHEFNNLMTTIIGLASLILAEVPAAETSAAEAPPEDDVLREAAQGIQWAGRSAHSLLCQVLPQEDRQMPRPQILDLDVLLAGMLDGLARRAGRGIELVHHPGTDGNRLRADPAQIEEMVTHLATNAIEAMPEGGVLTLATTVVCLEEEDCRDRPGAEPGTFVCLSVTDTGIGMDEETLGRIFEPFFSTRAKSAGLGLPAVSRLLRQVRGWIEISSTSGQGTTGQVFLPAVSREEEVYPADWVKPAGRADGDRQRSILLVEDDESVQAAVAKMLQARGYAVSRAGCGRAALELFDAQQGAFDLLLSDMALPDKDGLGLADYCRSQQPGMGVLLTSGYTDQRACWSTAQERGYHFLQKPFEFQELVAAVEQALADPIR